MATPVQWLAAFQVNVGGAATGDQEQPQIIGLSNGNILVAWEELTEGIAGSTGDDIAGKIFDAQGDVVRDSFQINALRAFDEELDFDIAATSNGGFVITYIDDDISDANQTTVVWERMNASGNFISGGVLDNETAAADNLANPQIALDLASGNDFVAS